MTSRRTQWKPNGGLSNSRNTVPPEKHGCALRSVGNGRKSMILITSIAATCLLASMRLPTLLTAGLFSLGSLNAAVSMTKDRRMRSFQTVTLTREHLLGRLEMHHRRKNSERLSFPYLTKYGANRASHRLGRTHCISAPSPVYFSASTFPS